ncbi:transposase [Ornithinimicrobium sp. LYQ103]|uniref:transposase n=1 Tax=Ornithinimicrobium sp. LYQ103 TaxID=3378796 RepID=UPI0038521B3D
MSGLRPVVADEQLEVLRMCVDRRASLGREHTRKVSRLHKLLLELIPGGAKRSLSAARAKGLLRKVRPATAAGRVRKAHAAELVSDLATIYARSQAADKELKALVKATGTTLLDLQRIGPSGAARLLAEVGDITRFPDRNHFASWNGSAPIDASSGDQPATGSPARATDRSTGGTAAQVGVTSHEASVPVGGAVTTRTLSIGLRRPPRLCRRRP